MRRRLFLAATVLTTGCTRDFYRTTADQQVYPIIGERVFSPSSEVGRIDVMPQPQSRLADPYHPDRPPQPPDDPLAHPFMTRPYGLPGSKKWGKHGSTPTVELAGWEAAAGLDPDGTLTLDREKAFDIALVNSREYQTAVEQVYLTALALTFNRFEFDCRYFLTNSSLYTTAPKNQAGFSTDVLTSNSNIGFAKAFAGGGQLLVDFANSLVFSAGPTGQTSLTSNLLVSLTQPLLRGGGRAFRLESLTQAERDTLYAVRNFARFRKQFWAGVTTSNGGYLDLLVALQNIRNQEANLRTSEQTYNLYQELIKGGKVSPAELEQFYQRFVQSRLGVQSAETALQNQLDGYKLTLGIPVTVPTKLDDTLLDPFVLNEPELEGLRDEVEKFQKDRLAAADAPADAAGRDRLMSRLRSFADKLAGQSKAVERELADWEKRLDERKDVDDRDRVMGVFADLSEDLPEAVVELKKLAADLAKPLPAAPKAADDAVYAFTTRLLTVTDAVLAVQTEIRVYRIELPSLDWEEDAALAYARDNRLDLQTGLAQVTDNWRRVRVTANQLLPGLTVNGTANVGTDPDRDNPFGFAAEASRYNLGVQFDGPLNRRAERNAYRAALIGYHASRRQYMALADTIDQQVRRDLRQLKLARLSFETARQSLLSSARQLENEKLRRTRPDANAGSAGTLSLLQAQDALLGARNALIGSFVGYEQLRIQLLLDLEALTLDTGGRPVNERSTPPAGRPGSEPLPAPKPLPQPAEGKGAGR